VPPKAGGDFRHAPGKANGASTLSPEDLVSAARGSGVVFQLAPEGDVFTPEWRGPFDPLVQDAIHANYDEILKLLKREAGPPWT
jgi:hypothetical protein